MVTQCVCPPDQRLLPLAGGSSGKLLEFFASSSGRYFAATHGAYSYEILPVPMQTLWQARIRSIETGSEIASQIFGIKQLAEAKDWLQGWAIRRGGGE